jgi:ubiquitin-protein ligase
MNPRMRRLIADSEGLRSEFAGHPYIATAALSFDPSESYRLTYRLRGVSLDATGQPQLIDFHQATIQLGSGYPRQKPLAIMETAIFHPNFGPRMHEEICIGDYWSPMQTLADIVVTIGEMIQYQRYNIRSPLNAVAARWAAEHPEMFPVGHVSLFQAEPAVAISAAPVERAGFAAPALEERA